MQSWVDNETSYIVPMTQQVEIDHLVRELERFVEFREGIESKAANKLRSLFNIVELQWEERHKHVELYIHECNRLEAELQAVKHDMATFKANPALPTSLFALRFSNFKSGKHTGKPDGMFIRKDGLLTDHKPSAKLFETVNLALEYAKAWKMTTTIVNGPLFVVQGTVKHILHEQIAVEYTLE